MNLLTTNKNPIVQKITSIIDRHKRKKEIDRRMKMLIDRFGYETTYNEVMKIVEQGYFVVNR